MPLLTCVVPASGAGKGQVTCILDPSCSPPRASLPFRPVVICTFRPLLRMALAVPIVAVGLPAAAIVAALIASITAAAITAAAAAAAASVLMLSARAGGPDAAAAPTAATVVVPAWCRRRRQRGGRRVFAGLFILLRMLLSLFGRLGLLLGQLLGQLLLLQRLHLRQRNQLVESADKRQSTPLQSPSKQEAALNLCASRNIAETLRQQRGRSHHILQRAPSSPAA